MEGSCPGGVVSGAGLMPVYQFAPTGFLAVLQPIVYPCLAPMGLAPHQPVGYLGMAAAQSFSCGAQPCPFGLAPHTLVRQQTGSLASRAHLSVPPEPPWWSANRMDISATSNQASGDAPASPATSNQEATVPGNFQPDSHVNGRVRPGNHDSGGALFFQGGNHRVHFDSHDNSRMLSDNAGMVSDNHGSGGALFSQGGNHRVHFDSHGNKSDNHADAMMRNNRVSDNHGSALSNDNHGNSELHSDGRGHGYSRHHGNGGVSPSNVCGAYRNHGNGEVSLDHLNNVEARSTRPAGRAESRTPDLKRYNNLLSPELKYSQNPRKTYPHSVNNAETSEKKSASMFPHQPGVVVSHSSDVPPRKPTTIEAEVKEEILGVLRKNGAMGIEELSMRLGMERRVAEWVQMCLQELQESGEVVRKGGEYSTCAK